MLLTFDIEDWFHILNPSTAPDAKLWSKLETRFEPILDDILKLLAENNLSAVFFIVGWLAERYPSCVRKIVDHGHLIGSHSYSHQLVFSQSREQFHEDTYRSIEILSKQSATDIKMYRAPGFSIRRDNIWAFEILANLGIKRDFSIFGARRYHGGLTSDVKISEPFTLEIGKESLDEFPLNVRSMLGVNFVYSGGGYFRLINKYLLRYLISTDTYVMGYFHPRDFDCAQPRLQNLDYLEHFRYYVGLKSSFEKLRYLISKVEIEAPDEFFARHKPKATYSLEDL